MVDTVAIMAAKEAESTLPKAHRPAEILNTSRDNVPLLESNRDLIPFIIDVLIYANEHILNFMMKIIINFDMSI